MAHVPSAPSSRRRPVLLGTVVALVGLALAVTLVVLLRGGASHHGAGKVAAAPVAKPTPSTSAPTTSATTPSPTPTKTKPPIPHDVVAAAAPTRFVYAAPHYKIHAQVCGMEYVRPLDPPGEQHHTVCWVQHDFGSAPGSHSDGTTYVLGHSWAQDRLEVLNKISETAMREVLPKVDAGDTHLQNGIVTYRVTHLDGNVITLRTPTGVLKYTVRSAYAVAKADAGYVHSLMAEHKKNRVVIITCGELNGIDYDYNIIVSAYLTSSKATTSTT